MWPKSGFFKGTASHIVFTYVSVGFSSYFFQWKSLFGETGICLFQGGLQPNEAHDGILTEIVVLLSQRAQSSLSSSPPPPQSSLLTLAPL
jgi:hypothetical protein